MPPERIPIASDHACFESKERLEHTLRELGFDVEDLGTDSSSSTSQAGDSREVAS